ncbi:hypothetical protein CK203_029643 [Vitis vinifera]|uniref:Uncharacterized protein n=1 Tax=Vitis vinifera TaxID=29760 RepID=A0A438III6_VITVI|nr:hypothetical protein CK203_029643 [Vitis vinifera]
MEFPSSSTLFAFLLFSIMLFKKVRRFKANDSIMLLPHAQPGQRPTSSPAERNGQEIWASMHLQLGEVPPLWEEEVSNVIKRIASHSGSTINLSEEISSVTCHYSKSGFWKICKDQDSFIGAVTEMAELATGFCAADVFLL